MKIKFKKSSICILVFIIIILIIAVFTNISSTGSSNTSDSFYSDDSTTEITSDISTKQTNTSYGCLDKDYCYITNPFRLASIDFLAVGLTTYGDYVNEVAQSLGYTNTQLEITEVSEKSSHIIVKMQIINTDSYITVTYDNLTNEFSYEAT